MKLKILSLNTLLFNTKRNVGLCFIVLPLTYKPFKFIKDCKI